MTVKRYRPRRRHVITHGSMWELAQQTCNCEFCESTIHRGTLLLIQVPGRIRHCVRCAKTRRDQDPPSDLAHLAGPEWTGIDGRAAQLPEGDR